MGKTYRDPLPYGRDPRGSGKYRGSVKGRDHRDLYRRVDETEVVGDGYNPRGPPGSRHDEVCYSGRRSSPKEGVLFRARRRRVSLRLLVRSTRPVVRTGRRR